MTIRERLNRQSLKYHTAIAMLLMLATGLLDYWTGFELRLEILYLAPISYVTWFVGRKAGIAVSFLSLLVIQTADFMAGKSNYRIQVEIWNAAMFFVFFIVVALLVHTVRAVLRQRESLINELQTALSAVKELNGIIPICANCKKIRDDEGYWQDVAVYISKHTNAEFSHGLCRECAAKLYPGFIKKEGK